MKQHLFSETIGIPIIASDSQFPLSVVKDILMDPETGKILAFLLPRGKMVMIDDVSEWKEALFIEDESFVIPVHEVIRVKEILEKKISYFGKKVMTENKVYLGRVYDLSFDAVFGTLQSLYVAKFFLIFRYEPKIIDRSSILEVRRDRIIVKDPLQKEPEKTPAVSTLSPA